MKVYSSNAIYDMALLGQAPTGTSTINIDFIPENIAVIDSVTGLPAFATVTQLSIVSAGQQIANLTGARIAGFGRIGQFISGAAQLLGSWLQLALGRVNGSTTITITHANVATLQVFGVSSGFSNDVVNYVETSINANANQSFGNFEALILSTPANVDRVNITFADGFNDDFSVSELKAMVSSLQNTNADGLLNGGLLIPNLGNIVNCVVYINALGNCVVGVKRIVLK